MIISFSFFMFMLRPSVFIMIIFFLEYPSNLRMLYFRPLSHHLDVYFVLYVPCLEPFDVLGFNCRGLSVLFPSDRQARLVGLGDSHWDRPVHFFCRLYRRLLGYPELPLMSSGMHCCPYSLCVCDVQCNKGSNSLLPVRGQSSWGSSPCK